MAKTNRSSPVIPYLISALLLAGVLVMASHAQARTRIAFVFSRPELCPSGLCLHGHFKEKSEVLLLSKEKDQTCHARVGKSIRVPYEPGAFDASELTGLKKCKIDQKSIFLAVFEKQKVKFKSFSPQDLTGPDLDSLQKQMHKEKVFAQAWKKEVYHPEANKDRQAYSIKDYKALPNLGFVYELSKNDPLYLLRQKFGETATDGILFSKFRNTWSVTSSSFTTGIPFVFKLDKRVYILSEVTCQMACGYLDFEVYEFNGRIFKLIGNNADLST